MTVVYLIFKFKKKKKKLVSEKYIHFRKCMNMVVKLQLTPIYQYDGQSSN